MHDSKSHYCWLKLTHYFLTNLSDNVDNVGKISRSRNKVLCYSYKQCNQIISSCTTGVCVVNNYGSWHWHIHLNKRYKTFWSVKQKCAEFYDVSWWSSFVKQAYHTETTCYLRTSPLLLPHKTSLTTSHFIEMSIPIQ